MVGVAQVFPGDAAEQALLDFEHVLAGGEAGAVGEAEDVGVDGHRRLAEDGVEHHVGGLAADAGEGFEGFAVVGYLAAVAFDELAGELRGVLGLVAEQADGLDVFGDAGFAQVHHGLGGRGDGEELAGGDVDALVGGLGRQHHRHQQLEGAGVFQLGGGVGVGVAEAAERFGHRGEAHVGHQAGSAGAAGSVGVAGGLARRRACLRASIQLRPAIRQPRAMKAPGGRMAIRKPG